MYSKKNFFKTINYKHEADILMPDGQKMPPTGMKAKMAKKPFPKKSESKIGKILSLIHTDNVWSNVNYNSRRKRSWPWLTTLPDTLSIAVNPRELGQSRPPRILWWRIVRSPRIIIISHNVQFCTWIWDENSFQSGDFSEIERFVYIKKHSGDDTLNPVALSSICWTFGTQPPVFNPGPTTPRFPTRLTPLTLRHICWVKSQSMCKVM